MVARIEAVRFAGAARSDQEALPARADRAPGAMRLKAKASPPALSETIGGLSGTEIVSGKPRSQPVAARLHLMRAILRPHQPPVEERIPKAGRVATTYLTSSAARHRRPRRASSAEMASARVERRAGSASSDPNSRHRPVPAEVRRRRKGPMLIPSPRRRPREPLPALDPVLREGPPSLAKVIILVPTRTRSRRPSP